MLDADNLAEGQDPTTETSSATTTPAPATGAAGADAPSGTEGEQAAKKPARKSAAKKTAAKKTTAKKTTAKKTTTRKTAAKKTADAGAATPDQGAAPESAVTPDNTDAADTGLVAGAPQDTDSASGHAEAPAAAKKAAAKKSTTAKKAATKKTAAKKTTATKRTTAKKAATGPAGELPEQAGQAAEAAGSPAEAAESPAADTTTGSGADTTTGTGATTAPPAIAPLFQPPDPSKAKPTRKRAQRKSAVEAGAGVSPEAGPEAGTEAVAETDPETGTETVAGSADAGAGAGTGTSEDREDGATRAPRGRTRKSAQTRKRAEDETSGETGQQADSPTDRETGDHDADDESGREGSGRRRRRRGGRRRRKSGEGDNGPDSGADEGSDGSDRAGDAESGDDDGSGSTDQNKGGDTDSEAGSAGSRRRRRRRRSGDDGDTTGDEPANTVTKVRKPRSAEDEITALSGSTRLEAKKQRRREGREAGRRRAPIVSEAEFLARREAVDRVMVIRQNKDLTQIAVLEDKVLVEHYVARESQTSLIGNVYLGRVQNVLPSMEAAFIDIGKGRNAVLYAGEVNWSSLGAKDGQPRKIESVLKSGQPILVQVTKDPIGHKGARLTSQISLPGRFLVYVPDGTTSGISRKLPDTERTRLKTLLKEIVPDSAGVIVRTAAEGASEDELTRDVERLTARWEDIQGKVKGGNAPQLLYGEPDLTLKVVRDLFTEDFGKLVVSGDDAWDMVEAYVQHVAPDLEDRLERHDGARDVFAEYRIDEQIAKALDRKVWLPSGGSLIIDRTEAMTVVDVNTGKFTGSGGNLEETVTKNNLEAAEEIVRQLRLRDIGGIIVVDFIDMVLESNRDLVLRRMVECLGRDRTRHQVAEVTSLGLVQMTRKRIGTGLLEAFSESCEHCGGRGLVVHHEPIDPKKKQDDEPRRGRRGGRSRDRDNGHDDNRAPATPPAPPSPKDIAAMARADQQAAGGPVPFDDADESAADLDAGEPTVADKPVADESVAQPAGTAPSAEAAPPVAGGPSPEAAEPAPVAAKKATTRKRSARRAQGPAGEPTIVAAEATIAAAEPAATAQAAGESAATEPAQQDAPAQDTASGEAPPQLERPEPSAPKVVATVRRRGAARRPAGPPAAASSDGAGTSSDGAASDGAGGATGGTVTGAVDGDAAQLPVDVPSDAADEQPAPAHVPVKRKGSRKR